ncbi:hypothetical protein CRUP_008001 [Coryphaenoides rupestris]|nr:hypothetical protein CRUP_008001 [Coryphaenoides rupestris]
MRDGVPKVKRGWPGADANVPKLSFSAALTNPMERPGVFTAPVDGHYFFSAVLTGHKNEKIEAVLSKSNYGMARVDSGGYQPEGLENKPVAEANTPPGSLAVFSVILPLQVQDTVCIDLVMGQAGALRGAAHHLQRRPAVRGHVREAGRPPQITTRPPPPRTLLPCELFVFGKETRKRRGR